MLANGAAGTRATWMGKPTGRNELFGKSDIEGKAAMVAASELGSERVSNERERMSQSFRSLDVTPILFPKDAPAARKFLEGLQWEFDV